MPRKIEKKERGVFEKEPGSQIWWIRYYIDGRERREKVGRRGDEFLLTPPELLSFKINDVVLSL